MRSASAPDRTPRRVLAMILALTPLAWFLRFVQDDALISFRYAEHLADGRGLVFNPGMAPVEGYTNFLWTVLLALPHGAGLSPVVFVFLAGLVLLPLTLLGMYTLGRAVFDSPMPALIAVLLAGTNYTFVSYATGGLETMLQTALVVWVYAMVARAWNVRSLGVGRAAMISLLVALAGLTRMDSAIVLIPAGVMCALIAGRSVRAWMALALPVGAIMLAWLGWKLSYYGGLLPNTLEAKAGTGWSPIRGVWYLLIFALSYGLWLLAPIALLRSRPLRSARTRGVLLGALVLPIALWCVYLIYAGGDFMEFRFVVPIVPLGALLLAGPTSVMSTKMRTALVLLAVAFSVSHGVFFPHSPLKRGVESIPGLAENLTDPETGWTELGLRLRRDLGDSSDPPIIAVTPAGAIAYYSGLPTIDMIGLNDREIAQRGVFLSNRAGHKKIATIEMLIEKGVHLVIGHPQPFDESLLVDGRVPRAALDPIFLTRGVPDPGSIPEGAQVVAFPSTTDDDGPMVYALLLKSCPVIEQRISKGVWSIYDIGPGRAGPMSE